MLRDQADQLVFASFRGSEFMGGWLDGAERLARSGESRLRPDMRMTELFAELKAKVQPSEQTADEFEQSLRDFVDMHGDLLASEITDQLDYRDDTEKLPRSMRSADRALPFPDRVRKYENASGSEISKATVNKRVGAVQAFLTFAFKQNWLSTSKAHLNAARTSDDCSNIHPVPRSPLCAAQRARSAQCSRFVAFAYCRRAA